MQIQQFQVAADPVQDRLLLRLLTPTQEEIRVFFTRRFLRELWPHLVDMLFGHLGAREIHLELKEDLAPPASLAQPRHSENPSFPLGSSPLLAAEATVEAAGDGLCRLTVRELKERSFTMKLNADLLQALCSMLRATSEQSKWDLPLDYAMSPTAAQAGASASADTVLKSRLH